MLRLVITLCLIGASWEASIPVKHESEKGMEGFIVGGKNASIEDFPYVVAMLKRGHFACGGSIVTPRHVVTAAHCSVGVKPEQMVFRANATKLSRGGVSVRAKRIHVHPEYNARLTDYDVAVVELEEPLKFGKGVQNISLVTEEPDDSSLAQTSGWGHLRENGGNLPDSLQTVILPMVNRSVCEKNYNVFQVPITSRMICAGVEGKDACQGDSGGPLAVNGKLAGIVSFGNGCGRKNFPGVFTNVADKEIMTFIRKYIQM